LQLAVKFKVQFLPKAGFKVQGKSENTLNLEQNYEVVLNIEFFLLPTANCQLQP